jgi:hypothetical protein
MKSVLAAVVTALLVIMLAMQAVPVSAQRNVNLDAKQKADEAEAAARAKERKDVDRSYKGAIDRLPDQKLDPWRNMR